MSKSKKGNRFKVQLRRQLLLVVPLIQMLFPALKAWDLHKPPQERCSFAPHRLRITGLLALDVVLESLA